MKTFKSFFLIALGFFLLLFLARFLILAFVAAIFLTFISYVVRAVKYHTFTNSHTYRSGPWSRSAYMPLPGDRDEPLFYEKEKETDFNWSPDYRTIEVR